jgi:hypothetical protein
MAFIVKPSNIAEIQIISFESKSVVETKAIAIAKVTINRVDMVPDLSISMIEFYDTKKLLKKELLLTMITFKTR